MRQKLSEKILHKNVHLRFNNNIFQVSTTDVFSQNVGVQTVSFT